jgi:hypothetical protein
MKNSLYIHKICRAGEADYSLLYLLLHLCGNLIPPKREEGYLCPDKLASWIFRKFVNHVV